MMNKNTYYMLGFILCCAHPAWADAPEPAAGSGAWILTLETIKAKAKDLMARNTALSAEYNTLAQDINNLNAAVDAQNTKNMAITSFLKDRHGRTDQQVRIEELEAQIKEQKTRLNDRQREYDGLKGEAASLERKVKLKQVRVTDWELRQGQQPSVVAPQVPSADAELDGLHQQLEAEKTKEVYLEDELARMTGGRARPVGPVVQAAAPNNAAREQDRERIMQVLRKKDELEAKIRDHERSLKAAQGISRGNIEKKKIIHDIVQADARNQGLREGIARLREDVALLRDQIGKLERRSGLVLNKDGTR